MRNGLHSPRSRLPGDHSDLDLIAAVDILHIQYHLKEKKKKKRKRKEVKK